MKRRLKKTSNMGFKVPAGSPRLHFHKLSSFGKIVDRRGYRLVVEYFER
jgi:hypothetical protein